MSDELITVPYLGYKVTSAMYDSSSSPFNLPLCQVPHPFTQKSDVNELICLSTYYTLGRISIPYCVLLPELKVSKFAKILKIDDSSLANSSNVINNGLHVFTPNEVMFRVFHRAWDSISAETAKALGYFSAASVLAYKFNYKHLGDRTYPYQITGGTCVMALRTAMFDHKTVFDVFSLPSFMFGGFIVKMQDDDFALTQLSAEDADTYGFDKGVTAEQIFALASLASQVMNNACTTYSFKRLQNALNCFCAFVHYISVWEQGVEQLRTVRQ